MKNPELKPIEHLYLEKGNRKVLALSEEWVTKHSFARYVPIKTNEAFDEDFWLTNVEQFNKDLLWILSLSYHRFWSHVMFDKEFLNPLLYFLQESTPFYIPLKKVVGDNNDVPELYEKVCRNALVIVCRLITNRESEVEFMSREKQADIIYKNFVITMPMLFDIVSLYGNSNQNMIQKIVDSLLKIEPMYLKDLKISIKFIQSTFEVMRKKLEEIEAQNVDLSLNYEDLVLYLMNIATTLNRIIDLAPNEVKAYCSKDLHLEQSIAHLYDNFIPLLYQYANDADSGAWYLTYINYSRVELINCYRSLISHGTSAILNAGEKNRQKFADGVLSTLTETAGYKTFITDYVKIYPVEMDLDIITQSAKNADKIKLDFVADAFKPQRVSVSTKVSNGFSDGAHFEKFDEDDIEGACAYPLPQIHKIETPGNVEEILQMETAKILELFPTYGVGYIRRLLKFYDISSETVISKILEGSLDATFQTCDDQETFIPPETPDKVFQETGIERSNIYNGDKYDVLRNDEFGGHVKKNGKFITKKEPKTLNELLNDKSHIQKLKERYQGYGLVEELEDSNLYDDEPDDSYDVYAESEPKTQLRFQGKMREMLPDDVECLESEEEEEEEPTSLNNVPKNPLEFCENPEIIRARREQHYHQKMAKKYPNRAHLQSQPQEQQKNRDVVGGQKGKGQSNEVLRNRQQKSANKSSRANHNRKAGSTFKQSRGMF